MVAGVVVRVMAETIVMRVTSSRCCHCKATSCSWVQGCCCRCCSCVRVVMQWIGMVMMVAHARQTASILVIMMS